MALTEGPPTLSSLSPHQPPSWWELSDDEKRKAMTLPSSLTNAFRAVGAARHTRRRRGEHVRGQLEPLLGGAVRQGCARHGRLVGEAVWQLAHRLVQGPRHDGAGVAGEPHDPQQVGQYQGGRVRQHRRHFGGGGGVLRGGWHPVGGVSARRQDQRGAAGATDRQRLGGGERVSHLPGQLDESAAAGGPEDGERRDRAAV
eukprot:ctg_478.g248